MMHNSRKMLWGFIILTVICVIGFLPIKDKKNYTVYFFTAEWCEACQLMKGNMEGEKVQAELKKFGRYESIDTDKNPSLLKKFNITQIPTMVIFHPKKDMTVRRHVGYLSPGAIYRFLTE